MVATVDLSGQEEEDGNRFSRSWPTSGEYSFAKAFSKYKRDSYFTTYECHKECKLLQKELADIGSEMGTDNTEQVLVQYLQHPSDWLSGRTRTPPLAHSLIRLARSVITSFSNDHPQHQQDAWFLSPRVVGADDA